MQEVIGTPSSLCQILPEDAEVHHATSALNPNARDDGAHGQRDAWYRRHAMRLLAVLTVLVGAAFLAGAVVGVLGRYGLMKT